MCSFQKPSANSPRCSCDGAWRLDESRTLRIRTQLRDDSKIPTVLRAISYVVNASIDVEEKVKLHGQTRRLSTRAPLFCNA